MPTNKATKDQLRKEIIALRSVGNTLSNVAYNLSQPSATLDDHIRKTLEGLYKEWDKIKRSEKKR